MTLPFLPLSPTATGIMGEKRAGATKNDDASGHGESPKQMFHPLLTKSAIVVAALLYSSLATAAEPLTTIENCVLVPTEWADGDSFLVRTPNNEELTVRLYGVDCLEWHVTDATDERRLRAQRRYFGITSIDPDTRVAVNVAKSFGESAHRFASTALSEPFSIHTAFSDARGDGKHKRIYAFVTTGQGTDLASELVRAGLARAFGVTRETQNGHSQDEYRANLADLELQAASSRRGIWSKTNWESLPDERRTQRIEDEELAIAIGEAPLAPGQLIDPNTAARDELMMLPGIGEELANRIIEHRPIRAPSDLLKVPGIGPGILAKIHPHLKLPAL